MTRSTALIIICACIIGASLSWAFMEAMSRVPARGERILYGPSDFIPNVAEIVKP